MRSTPSPFDSTSGIPACHREGYLPRNQADALFQELLTQTPWADLNAGADRRPGRSGRLVCWVGERSYDFYGSTVKARPWTPTLAAIRDRIERDLGSRFNSVLINLYRDGADSVDWHADDEKPLGNRPTIASLSLGSTRSFLMRHTPSGEVAEFALKHGSLIVMYDDAQMNWQHAVPPAREVRSPRINLTFRLWN